MQKGNWLLGILIILILLPFISSAPPVTQVQQFQEGYLIEETSHDILKQNQDYHYNFFVYNQSNGILIDNTSVTCNFILSNSSGETLFNQEAIYDADTHWEIEILKDNFSLNGGYPYGIVCQSDSFGGALSGFFEVTKTGKVYSQAEATSYFIVLFAIIILLVVVGYGVVGIDSKNQRNDDGEIIGVNDLKYVRYLCIFLFYGLITWMTNILITISNNYIDLGVAMEFFAMLFRVMMALLYPFMIFMVIYGVIQAVKDSKISKLIDRGFNG